MNCKPGDLAIVKRSSLGNAGKVVKVMRWEAEGDITPCGALQRLSGWRCEGVGLVQEKFFPIAGYFLSEVVSSRVFSDANLIPIRDQDGEDETLTWAGKPADTKEPA